MATNATELAGSFWHWNARELGIGRDNAPLSLSAALARVKAHLRDAHGLSAGDPVDVITREGNVFGGVAIGKAGPATWANWFNDDYPRDIVAFKPAGVLFPGRPRVIVRG